MEERGTILSCIMGAQVIIELPICFSDAEEESSDEDIELTLLLTARKRKLKTPQRIEDYLERVIPGLTSRQFQEHFRITIEAYEYLLSIIGPLVTRQAPTGRPTIDSEKQLLATIWLLATPDSYRSVGERFNLAKSSLSGCFIRIIKILNSIAPQIIKWPSNEDVNRIKRKFHSIAGVNNVIGAVDGTYILIKAPKEDPDSYITRKCNYAFTLQAICDPFLKFTDIFIAYPGSVSDVRIFRLSDIYPRINNNVLDYFPQEEFIIGDKAYPILTWCVPPYINRGNLTMAQVNFNTMHARTRQVIERAFALLFGRFRRLKFIDMNRHDLIPATVLAATVLHNICLNFNDLLVQEYIHEGVNHIQNDEDDVEHNVNFQGQAQGARHRDQICRELYLDYVRRNH